MLENPNYKTTDIKQGLVSIKRNQIQLLKQLRSEHQVLKSYNPVPISLIRQQSAESLQVSKQFQNVQQKHTRFGRQSQLINSISLAEIVKINENLEKENKFLQREKDLVEQDYEQMKQNYYNEKHRLKQTNIHIEFSEGMLLSIMKDVIQKENYQLIVTKVRKELSTFKIQYPQYNQYSLQQTIKMLKNAQINQQSQKSNIKEKYMQINHKNRLDNFLSQKNKIEPKGNVDFQQLIRQHYTQIEMKNSQIQQLKHRIRSLQDELMTISAQRKMKMLDLQRYKNQVRNLDDSISQEINCKRELENIVKIMQAKQKQLEEQIAEKDSKIIQLQTSLKTRKQGQILSPKSLQNIFVGNGKSYNGSFNSPKSNNDKQVTSQNIIESVSNVPIMKKINKNYEVGNNLVISVENPQIKRIHDSNKFLSQQNNILKRCLNDIQTKNMNLANQKNKAEQMLQSQIQRLTEINNSCSRRYQQQIISMKSQIDLLKQEYHSLIKQIQQLRQNQRNLKVKNRAIKIDKVVQHLWEIKNVQLDNLKQFLSSIKGNSKIREIQSQKY